MKKQHLNINRKDIKSNLQYNSMKKSGYVIILLLFLMVIIMVNFSSSAGSIGLVKQGNCINLYNYCPTCSYINLTAIKYPAGTMSYMNNGMTKTGTNYNYTFCNTTSLGDYSYTTCGDKEGIQRCEDIAFEVTPSGRGGNSNIAFVIILIVIIYAVTFVSFFGRNLPLSVLTGMFMSFFGLWIVRNGIVIYRDNLTNYFGYITIFIGVLIALWAAIEWIQEVY